MKSEDPLGFIHHVSNSILMLGKPEREQHQRREIKYSGCNQCCVLPCILHVELLHG